MRKGAGPFIASTLVPFALGFALGGYTFDRVQRGPQAPFHSVGANHATGAYTGP